MIGSSSPRIARTEIARWARDPVILVTVAALVALSAILTYLAVGVATVGTSSGGSGIQLQVDTVLTGESTNDDLASMARSTLTMLVPIAAIVVGVQFAGSELASGALLQIGVAARRLRYLFAVRVVALVLLVGIASAATAAVTLAAAQAAIAQTPELSQLTTWDAAWPTVAGASTQAIIIGLLAFALSALTRRWIVVTIGMLVYLVVIEPMLSGLVGDGSAWLPRTATSELMLAQPDLTHALPTAACALILASVAVMGLRRDRVAR